MEKKVFMPSGRWKKATCLDGSRNTRSSFGLESWRSALGQRNVRTQLCPEIFAAIVLGMCCNIEFRAYHIPGTAIMALGIDNASREMRAGAAPLIRQTSLTNGNVPCAAARVVGGVAEAAAARSQPVQRTHAVVS